MVNQISNTVKSGHGTGILYATFIGLVLSDIIPTPGDALYFYQQRQLKNRVEKKEITPKQYWLKNATGYYLYNSIWWATVFGAVALYKGDFSQKLKLGMALSGGGAVIAVLYKNIKKDEEQNGK